MPSVHVTQLGWLFCQLIQKSSAATYWFSLNPHFAWNCYCKFAHLVHFGMKNNSELNLRYFGNYTESNLVHTKNQAGNSCILFPKFPRREILSHLPGRLVWAQEILWDILTPIWHSRTTWENLSCEIIHMAVTLKTMHTLYSLRSDAVRNIELGPEENVCRTTKFWFFAWNNCLKIVARKYFFSSIFPLQMVDDVSFQGYKEN